MKRTSSRQSSAAGAEQRFLATYKAAAFPSVAVTVDVVLLTIRADALSVLLIERAKHPFRGRLALPGGFVRMGEDLDAAAFREVTEEAGPIGASVHLEQLGSYGQPDRDPRLRVVTVAYLALAARLPEPVAGGDAAAAHYHAVDGLRLDSEAGGGLALAFDHARILRDGLDRARAKLEYTSLATAFVNEPFTMTDLRKVYETVWAATLEPNNFRRKVLATSGFVTPLGRQTTGGRGRPAQLYRRGHAQRLHPPLLRPSTAATEVAAMREDGRHDRTSAPRRHRLS